MIDNQFPFAFLKENIPSVEVSIGLERLSTSNSYISDDKII